MMRFFLFAAIFCVALPCFSSEFTVGDIRIEGLQRVSASPVFAAMPVQVGDVVNDDNIRQIVKDVFATGFFTDIKVFRDGDLLIVDLKERPTIKSVVFEGNKVIKDEPLLAVMNENDLGVGDVFQRYPLQGIIRELERQYVSQARYSASVDVDVEALPNNKVAIQVNVDEGKSARIRHLNIVGNHAFDDGELLKLFELNKASWLTFFSSSDKYAKEKLSGDLESLKSYYLDRGYLDFDIVSTQVSLSPDKKSVFITLNISEGNVYTVKSTELAGDLVLPEKSLQLFALLAKGDVFSQGKMVKTTEYMKTALGNFGYTNAQVRGIPKSDPDASEVEITFFVDPGPRMYVRRISFRGNSETSDEVLRREMRQLESASASNARIEQSKVRLERLGYFKEVVVDTQDVAGKPDMLDVVFGVEEQSSGSISATLGYNAGIGVNFGLNLSESNWLGTGKKVSLSANRNRFETLYSLEYNDPYFTADGVSRGFSVYFRERDFNTLSAGSYSTDALGASVSFGYPISEISALGLSVGVNKQKVEVGLGAPQEIKQSPGDETFQQLVDAGAVYVTQTQLADNPSGIISEPVGVDESSPLAFSLDTNPVTLDMGLPEKQDGFIDIYGDEFDSATVNFTWNRRTLNKGILATRGTSHRLNLEASVPGSDLEFYKISYDGQAFLPINETLTLRFKTSLAYGDGYGDLDELPFFEHFFAGGFGSVRGFERSSLGPKGTPSQQYIATNSSGELTYDAVEEGEPDPENFTTRTYNADPAYILCDTDSTSDDFYDCATGLLQATPSDPGNRRLPSYGGNVLIEFSTELILPIPFIEDTRSMQLAAFVDAGNVFSSNCRSTQLNCSNVDLDQLTSSYGLGFTWISGLGPLTFSVAKPINSHFTDRREVFQFSFGAGF